MYYYETYGHIRQLDQTDSLVKGGVLGSCKTVALGSNTTLLLQMWKDPLGMESCLHRPNSLWMQMLL